MKYRIIHIIFSFCILTLAACNKKDAPANPCLGVAYDIEYSSTAAIGAQNNGSITVTYPLGDSITYSLNNGGFQPVAVYNNLAPGNYVLTVKNQKGCTDTTTINIPNYGPKYALVKQLITGYCGPCHLNGGLSGGINFDTDNSIISAWDRIKVRAVDGTPTFMPEGGQLTTIDKNKILDWINAGHGQMN